MTSTRRTTVSASLVMAALTLPVHAFAQATPPAQQVPPRPAGATAPLPPLPVTQIDDRLSAPARSGQAFSLSFSEPQPIRDVLLLMVKDTGLSVVIDPDVTGDFAGDLANVTLKEALELTLQPLGLHHTLTGKVLRVFRRPTETRFLSVDHVATRRSSERTISAPIGSAAGSIGAGAAPTGVSGGVTSSDTTDFYEELSRTIGPLLSGDGSFTIDRKAGLVRVTDYPDRLDRVSRYVELAELRATRQVQIHAMFVEVNLNDVASSGMDWSVVLKAAGDAVTLNGSGGTAPSGRPLSLNVRNLDGLLRAFGTQGVVNLLASPRVAVMNNEPAVIRPGTQQAFPAASDGVGLTVTPQISEDQIIQMSVASTVARSFAVRGADTLVRVREGETLIIDGLLQELPGRAPARAGGLAGVPILGRLFGRRPKPAVPAKTELVILLTPTLGSQ